MAVYAIFGGPVSEIDARIPATFKKNYKLAPGQWLVAYQASLPADVYQTLKNAAGGDFRCIVTPMNLYYGWHDNVVVKCFRTLC